MYLEGNVPEETLTAVLAVRGGRGGKRQQPSLWRIGKRGTVFSKTPHLSTVDLFKDVTHLYRQKKSGKRCGCTEWATTLWVNDAKIQLLQTPAQVRVSNIS